MLEAMFRNLNNENLLDIMLAYNSYIFAACTSGLFDTGWELVGMCEFYENEYQTVWDKEKGLDSFDYMYKICEV